MTRPLRIKIPGGLYHIYARGNDRQNIFTDMNDREKFLENLRKVANRCGWKCYAYCLMKNHYHLLLETADGDISKGMRQLNGVYAQYFNWKHDRVGHLFQGRYRALLVDRENYFLELCRYIVLNPVRAGIAEKPEDYVWSSYRMTAGLDKRDEFLDTDFILNHFSVSKELEGSAERNYARFVLDGISMSSPLEDVRGNLILGDLAFAESLITEIEESRKNPEYTTIQRNADRPELKDILDSITVSIKELRDKAICKAYRAYSYKQKEIAEYLGIHLISVHNIIKRNNNKLSSK